MLIASNVYLQFWWVMENIFYTLLPEDKFSFFEMGNKPLIHG